MLTLQFKDCVAPITKLYKGRVVNYVRGMDETPMFGHVDGFKITDNGTVLVAVALPYNSFDKKPIDFVMTKNIYLEE